MEGNDVTSLPVQEIRCRISKIGKKSAFPLFITFGISGWIHSRECHRNGNTNHDISQAYDTKDGCIQSLVFVALFAFKMPLPYIWRN
jgi:hypothetical protein